MLALLVVAGSAVAQFWSPEVRVTEAFSHGQVDWTEGLVLSRSTMRAYNIGLKELARWGDLAKVALAALLAATIFYGSFWTDYFGLVGVLLGSAVFTALFLVLLVAFRVPEVTAMLGRLRKTEAAPAKS